MIRKFRADIDYKGTPTVVEVEFAKETKCYLVSDNGLRVAKESKNSANYFDSELDAWRHLSEECRDNMEHYERLISRYEDLIANKNKTLNICVNNIDRKRREV